MFNTSPIVGMHFRPPAKSILQVLPVGAELFLLREPGNPYDHNAIQVLCPKDSIPSDNWDILIPLAAGHGFDEEELRSTPEWHLGYIPRTEAETLTPHWNNNYDDTIRIIGTLSFQADGKPQINWQWPLGQAPVTKTGEQA